MSDNLTVFGTDYTGVTGIKAKGTGNGTLAYIRPQGTKSISANGTGIDVTDYAAVDVAVASSTFVVTLSWNSTSEMWEPDCTYAEALAAYQTGKTVAFETLAPQDETVSGEYTPFGGGAFLYAVSIVSFDSESGDASGYVNTTHMWNSSEIRVIGTSTAWLTDSATAAPSDVMSGAVFYNSDGKQVGTATPSVPTLQSKSVSYTPFETAQSATVTADSGYDGLSSVDVSVGAISSTYVGSGITRRSSTDLTASGATVTVPSGYYQSQASKAVASGTAGTPSATKGTVSNHSVSVTPSVTNSTGYISGGTKTGTAVTVSASELVSGSETKTANGTYDVTNLASLVVALDFVTYYTSSSNPTSSQGSNGDIWLVTS